MSGNKRDHSGRPQKPKGLNLSAIDNLLETPIRKGFIGWIKSHWTGMAVFAFILLLGLGVMAKSGWLPKTDPLTGTKTGWFGKPLPRNAPSSWNPLAAFATPTPTPTPPLSKELIYAGSRLLSVEDSNANAAPPVDLALWRASTGGWFIYDAAHAYTSGTTPIATLGQTGDIPVQGDYDGDGKTDFSVFRPSEGKTYIIRSSDGSTYNVELGASGDIPVPADFDGDSKTDVVLWKSSDQNWKVHKSSTDTDATPVAYGSSSDVPISGDFDGDGKADKAYWRASDHSFHSINSSDGGARSATFGTSTGTPVCADYDGDGKTDFALLSGNSWIILASSTNTSSSTTWQTSGDIPVPNDYDGDAKADIAVWHPVGGAGHTTAYWYILQSHDQSTRTEIFGKPGDIPVPAYYRRH